MCEDIIESLRLTARFLLDLTNMFLMLRFYVHAIMTIVLKTVLKPV